MKTKQLVISSICLFATIGGLSAGDTKKISISAYDTMKYSVTTIEAKPGEKITVTLTNEGSVPKEAMGHNWVLLKGGMDAIKFSNTAATDKAEDYIPKALANQVIASIPLLGPKESKSVTFTAPSQPGSYNFLCTFPAHCAAGMKGVLVVK